jgi:glutamate-5-semialdehyde dehydrogenase
MTTNEILIQAAKAKVAMAGYSSDVKNKALYNMADALEEECDNILAANAVDVEEAKGKITDVMIDRLALTESRIKGMAKGLRDVADLPDPVGVILDEHTRADGLNIKKVAVPLGVVAIIYESRPNVTSDAAALCLKSGNVCVLRTGKEAHRSATAIVEAMRSGLEKAGVDKRVINLIEDTSRQSATELMMAVGFIDLLIPRGGAGLINACVQNAKVPCIQTGTGICHVYVDAKCSRPSVCNAMEVCLVNEKIAHDFLPLLWQRLVKDRQVNPVQLKLDEPSYKILQGKTNCFAADNNVDFDREFLDYAMAVKVVKNTAEAIAHIAAHSTGHSDCIVTENQDNANLFTLTVDSAAVYVNASTRFTDGGEFGLGCEMGISTQKLHARGPMGLKELTTYKYIVTGNGNIR